MARTFQTVPQTGDFKMKKQVRYGGHNLQKARLSLITEQQIAEICDVTGEGKGECVAAAITERYMRIVFNAHQQRINELQAHVLVLEAALVDAVN